MFTGLVQAVGEVVRVEPVEAGLLIEVDAGGWEHRGERGASICVSGCCLTLTDDPSGGVLRFVAVPETLEKTTLGGLTPKRLVNLERAVTPSTALGGHLVQGHVDGVGRVRRVRGAGEQGGGSGRRVRVAPPPGLMRCMTPKGSVCLDGVSLTIAEVGAEEDSAGWIEVALIPETLEKTTLGSLGTGDGVNVEADVVVKTVVNVVENYLRSRLRSGLVSGSGAGGPV